MLMLMVKRKMDAHKEQAGLKYGVQKQNITMVNRRSHTLSQPVAACQLNLGRTIRGSPGNDI